MTWDNARRISRPSGEWELLGEDRPCAVVDGVSWYWCALRKIGGWRIYSGVVRVPPRSADPDELVPQLREVVRTAKAVWKPSHIQSGMEQTK